MKFIAILNVLAAGEDEVSVDTKGIVTHSPILSETAEIIYGTLASLIIFFLLFKFAAPIAKKALAARTDRVQKELDSAAGNKAAALAEAENIRRAKGDIGAERERILADAKTECETVIADGRVRIDTELADVKARALADIETAKSRAIDELRFEIARLSATAVDRAVAESIDSATQQELIESFIRDVGMTKAGASA